MMVKVVTVVAWWWCLQQIGKGGGFLHTHPSTQSVLFACKKHMQLAMLETCCSDLALLQRLASHYRPCCCCAGWTEWKEDEGWWGGDDRQLQACTTTVAQPASYDIWWNIDGGVAKKATMPKEGAPFIVLSNLDTLAPVRVLML